MFNESLGRRQKARSVPVSKRNGWASVCEISCSFRRCGVKKVVYCSLEQLVLGDVVEGVLCLDLALVLLDFYVVVELRDLVVPVEEAAVGADRELGTLKADVALDDGFVRLADDVRLVARELQAVLRDADVAFTPDFEVGGADAALRVEGTVLQIFERCLEVDFGMVRLECAAVGDDADVAVEDAASRGEVEAVGVKGEVRRGKSRCAQSEEHECEEQRKECLFHEDASFQR